MQAAVTVRDFTKVYRLLQRVGLSQARIAGLTGQSQPEVSAIIHGRKVMAYDVLLRMVEGLGIPRGLAGLSFCRCAGPAAVVARRDQVGRPDYGEAAEAAGPADAVVTL